MFARLFSKKGEQHEEHDSFSHFGPVEEAEEENTAPNIVILNSLNHNQLLELLKVCPRHTATFTASHALDTDPLGSEPHSVALTGALP